MREWIDLIAARFRSRLCETDNTDWSAKLWTHYTDHPVVTLNRKGFHQDPMGIYFFPADHQPKFPVWLEKSYKFTARLKPTARVLEFGRITDEQLATILDLTHTREAFDAYIAQYPPKTHNDMLRMAWERMRATYMRSVPVAWTKALMRAGWDAVYDDTGAIHSAEPMQLLVLNPRVIKLIDMERQKMPVFATMQKLTDLVAKLAAPYGALSIERPKRVKERYSDKTCLEATIKVERSERNYLWFKISHRDEPRYRTKVSINVQYAMPSLGYGCGAEYSMATGEFDSFSNLDQLHRALDTVFAA